MANYSAPLIVLWVIGPVAGKAFAVLIDFDVPVKRVMTVLIRSYRDFRLHPTTFVAIAVELLLILILTNENVLADFVDPFAPDDLLGILKLEGV